MDVFGKKPAENQMAEYLRGRALSEASHGSLTEPLNQQGELDNYRKAAICLHEALRLQGFHKPPNDPAAWYAYKTKIRTSFCN